MCQNTEGKIAKTYEKLNKMNQNTSAIAYVNLSAKHASF